jgi:site-specific recombinase XerD
MPVVRITKTTAADYRRKRQREKPVSDATVNRDLSVLKHILYWGVDESLLAANPLARMKMVRERKTKRSVMSVEQEQKILATASEHLRPIIIAALDTGMRRGRSQ